MSYAIGLDYGTNSCRSLLVDLTNGEELGSVVFPYPSGELGILTDPSDPNVARQNPRITLMVWSKLFAARSLKPRKIDPGLMPRRLLASELTPREALRFRSTGTELRSP